VTPQRTSETATYGRPALLGAALCATILVFCAAVLLQAQLLLSVTLLGLFAAAFGLALRLHRDRLASVASAEAVKSAEAQAAADLHFRAVEALAQAIDAKDQTTHGHVRRTQTYAVGLGRLLGLGPSELEALRAGALLHDVGKLAVPDYILNKPGKLTPAEFEKMKVHAVVGSEIIRRVGFPYPVEEIVRHHHEKWDGSGYPSGLKGAEIPLVARIIGVIDFYDVSRCDRPYRVGMTREESLTLLKRMAGKSFDPQIVEVFVENVASFDAQIAEHDLAEQVPDRPALEDEVVLDATIEPPPAEAQRGGPRPSGFRTIAEAQREVFALYEMAQAIGSSLNLNDTLTLVTSKLAGIVSFDTCVVFVVDEKTGAAVPARAVGVEADFFGRRSFAVGEGVTGWVVANGRSMHNAAPELDLAGAPEEVAAGIRFVLSSPLTREDGAFGAITLYSSTCEYTSEHVRLLESVCLHASSAVNNALMYERTKETALTDPLTGLPNARALHLMLEQRLAECRRLEREPVALLCLDLDDFKRINDQYGFGVGDRLLMGVADVVKKQLRQMDVLARITGDEFVAVMPAASAAVAAIVAERIRAAVESEQFPVRTGKTTRLGISIGVGCYPAAGETADELILAAARDMHRQKQARKASLAPPRADEVFQHDNVR
jgi:diguanylate cyclase (GGDEF)-like protein/putative nucleotidyltransferase with HDIG domain